MNLCACESEEHLPFFLVLFIKVFSFEMFLFHFFFNVAARRGKERLEERKGAYKSACADV